MKILLHSTVALTAILVFAVVTNSTLIGEVNAATTHHISISDLTFNPQNLTVYTGDTVNWTNNDGFIHTLYFVRLSNLSTYTLSPPILPGESWSYTFAEEVSLQYLSMKRVWVTAFITVVEDTTPPQIGVPIQNPPEDSVPPNQEVMVSVNVSDTQSGVAEVILSYDVNTTNAWVNVTMTNTVLDTYTGNISGYDADTYVRYKITAVDNAGNPAVENNAGSYYVYTVIPEYSMWILLLFMFLATGTATLLRRRTIHNGKDEATAISP